ncbi:MAG: hypothetical protein ACKPJ4_01035, partial [Dolichospermum sp.]
SEHGANEVDIGLIYLQANVNPRTILASLSKGLPADVIIMDREEFIDFEKSYWTLRTPIGFVFNLTIHDDDITR